MGTNTQKAAVRINPTAKAKLAEIAASHDTTPSKYLEALLHYAISQHERPGSWEAASAFDFYNYDDRNEGAFADKWF